MNYAFCFMFPPLPNSYDKPTLHVVPNLHDFFFCRTQK